MRTLDESRAYLAERIEKTLAWLGFEPEDVEVEVTYKKTHNLADCAANCHWSAQTNIGDMSGVFPVAYFQRINGISVRRAVAETALIRWRALDAER